MKLRKAIEEFNFSKFQLEAPTFDRMDRAGRKLSQMADQSFSVDLQDSPEIVESTVAAIQIGNLPKRKVAKLMAMGGLPHLLLRDKGITLVKKFLNLVATNTSATLLRALLIGYLRCADNDGPLPKLMRDVLVGRLKDLPRQWSYRVETYALLDKPVGQLLSNRIIEDSAYPKDLLADAGFKGILKSSGFLRMVFQQVCRTLSEGHTNQSLERFWRFVNVEDSVLFGENLKAYSYALLSPYLHDDPDEETREVIQRFLIDSFGDPRLNQARWKTVPEEELTVIYRWLTKLSFEILLKVVNESNDTKQWAERVKFWTRYIESGEITEAWAALGQNAARIAGRLVTEGVLSSTKEYARLVDGSIDRWHSMIIMRMGDHIVTEWTHSGQVRFYNIQANKRAPKLYKPEYSVTSIRNDATTSYHKHHRGRWQYDVRSYIRRNVEI